MGHSISNSSASIRNWSCCGSAIAGEMDRDVQGLIAGAMKEAGAVTRFIAFAMQKGVAGDMKGDVIGATVSQDKNHKHERKDSQKSR
jgi:hypothetical protein